MNSRYQNVAIPLRPVEHAALKSLALLTGVPISTMVVMMDCCEASAINAEPEGQFCTDKALTATIIHQGAWARRNYRARASNPYRAGDWRHRAWEKGFGEPEKEEEPLDTNP
jgi:hypothetical protein